MAELVVIIILFRPLQEKLQFWVEFSEQTSILKKTCENGLFNSCIRTIFVLSPSALADSSFGVIDVPFVSQNGRLSRLRRQAVQALVPYIVRV